MAEEKKDPWLNYLALTTVILALCATMATFKGGQYSTRTVLSQTQASDQWAFYQAKSIKGSLYEIQCDQLEWQLKHQNQKASPEAIKELQEQAAAYAKKVEQYNKEKKEIEQEARNLERTRDDSRIHGQNFGIAIIFLQIAIVLSSIAALMTKKVLWYLGLLVSIGGLVYFANGFWLFVN